MSNRTLWNEIIPNSRAGGEFTFDFAMLLVLAGAIAFMGLLEDSSVVLVASMLVSPLMGPILAGVFGTVIRDASLRNQGVRHELAALVVPPERDENPYRYNHRKLARHYNLYMDSQAPAYIRTIHGDNKSDPALTGITHRMEMPELDSCLRKHFGTSLDLLKAI